MMRTLFFIGLWLPMLLMAYPSDSARRTYAVVFYNVENFFDTENDSLTSDDEFTPDGLRHWNKFRLNQKSKNIARTIVSSCGWSLPSVVGLCEVENELVLKNLCRYTPLKEFNYKFIHYDSPDSRGIDCAFLYRPSDFEILYSRPVRLVFEKSSSTTRDILYVKGVLGGDDTLHFFVNHWPSKYGGGAATIGRRAAAARLLRSLTDSVIGFQPSAKIIIMGDFNDTPDDPSLIEQLGACQSFENCSSGLVNVSHKMAGSLGRGSQKFNGKWSVIDQFIVSTSFYNMESVYSVKDAEIVWEDFLLTTDETYTGKRPFRTYHGMKYEGGFSDHMPIRLFLKKK
ncbi:MAG: endonuclease [Bacteroidales bacterium]|nr:endonuclease [Bacteroidales bacterium]